jgi:HlyD family secretion protein
VTPEQRPAWDKLRSEARGRAAGASTGRVWVPGPSGPKPIDVRLGLTDGASTEILGGALAEGAEVIVGFAPGAGDAQPAGLPRFRLF